MAKEENLVVDELLTKPSAVSPTLFVGLGGCGCKMVVRIARHLKRRHDYEERYKDLVKFALVDTNINDLESYREQADETFLISDFEKEEYANFASGLKFVEADPYFTQWVPQNYRFRAGDTAGAGQIRIESRLGCYYQMRHGDFVPRFRRLLESLKSHEHGHRRLDSREIRIVICYSVAGGTGSGSHLTIAYMLRDQAKALGKPYIIGVSVLPGVFEDKTGTNKDGTFANGYAALKENEHLMKLGAPESRFFPDSGLEFHYDPSDESKTHVREKPFEFLYLIDKPENFTVTEPIAAAADGLYLQFFSPLFGVQAGDYDNYTQHQRFLVPHDFEAKGIVGFSQFYGSFGAAVLLVPVQGLIEYCSEASALSLMRSSFLGDVPGETVYASLRSNPEPFFEVTEHDDEGARPLHLSDFTKKEEGVRKRLRDRLFAKRVRLLAKCEVDEGMEGRFLEMFRHGQRIGEMPADMGGVKRDEERVPRDREQLADRGLNYSIGMLVLDAIAGEDDSPRSQPGLLQACQRNIENFSRKLSGDIPVQDKMLVREWKSKAAGWAEDFKRQAMRTLERGYNKHGIDHPGLENLIELKFLEDDTPEVSLASKRYAVLAIREALKVEMPEPKPFEGFDLPEYEDDDKVREKDAPMLIDSLMDQAKKKAMIDVSRSFLESRAKLRDRLANYAEVSRSLEMGFDLFERERTKHLERLREQGCESANQFVLDAEALQLENGRRMWDFFYEDQIANMPELGLSNPHVQAELSGTVRDLSMRQGGGTTASLERLFESLRAYAAGILDRYIGGDPKALDRARRDGLRLSDALELEVVYRALYMSNLDEVRARGSQALRSIIAQYRAMPREEQIDLSETLHQDYLRDKVKRVVKEKASLLVSYDESRDQHGGVRPDHVFLAAIDANFKNSSIEEALRGADVAGMTWVKDDWNNPQQVVFYRAVLNVPLYVFGRMEEMKDYYYRFKNLAKRSKVLHTDKNWEDSLPDLDPDTTQEKHRQELVREHIINFGALLTIRDPFMHNQGYIVRRDGFYCLRSPSAPRSPYSNGNGAPRIEDDGMTILGNSLAESIEHLPEILGGEKVKFLPFQQLLNAVRAGLAPQVLRDVVKLPFQWRKNRDELRTQYGTNPSPQQRLKLEDYTNSFYRLQEALDGLLEKLRNDEKERKTIGGDYSSNSAGLDEELVSRNLRQSIEILRGFSESWRTLEHPEESNSVPQNFRGLFRPLAEQELNDTLEWLHNGVWDDGNGAPPSGQSANEPSGTALPGQASYGTRTEE